MLTDHINLVQSFYTEILGKFDFELAQELIAEDYIQHNPHVRTGREGVLEALTYLKSLNLPQPEKSPIQLIFGENDLVVALLLVKMGKQTQMVVDLFRIENGKLAEHWDCIQPFELTYSDQLPILPMKANSPKERNKSIGQDLIESIYAYHQAKSLGLYIHPDGEGYFPDPLPSDSTLQEKLLSRIAARDNYHIHRIVGQGNFVFVQSSFSQGNAKYVGNDLLCWEAEQVRYWYAVQQEIPEQMRHTNGMI
ncbi:MAG: ester cyclase [Bacteroidota bacterium]